MNTLPRIAPRLAVLALVALALTFSTPFALGGQMFPLVTNNGDLSFGLASNGTNYLVGIQGDYVTTNRYEISAQMFGPTGAPLGARLRPAPGHTGGGPRIACSGAHYLMVWPDNYLSGSQSSICGQMVSSSGALLGSWFAITTNAAQKNPFVAYGAGTYLVVWGDTSNTNLWAIHGQLVSSAGALVGGPLIIGTQVKDQFDINAAVAFDGTNFLVVWHFTATGTNYLIHGAFVSPSGAVGAPFAIGQTDTGAPNLPCAVFNGTNYLVVYNSGRNWGDEKPLYGRLVTPAGAFSGNEFLIVTNGDPRAPFMAFDGAHYLLCWNTNHSSAVTNNDVLFQFLNANGQPIGEQFAPFTAQGNQVPVLALPIFDGQRFVVVASLSSGYFRPGAYGAGVYGTFIPRSTAPPQLSAGPAYAGQPFSLSVAGTPGLPYALQMATRLAPPDWTPLVVFSPTDGPFHFTDVGATNHCRFYRVEKQ